MPRFFFHFISPDEVGRDDVGTVFPSIEAAYLDAYDAVLGISFDKLRARDDPTKDVVEITDEGGRMLMYIPFSEVLGPRQKTGIQTHHPATHDALQACQRQMLRSHTLLSELRAEFMKTQSAFRAIQAKLASLKCGPWPD
jgi:hypothetical protein